MQKKDDKVGNKTADKEERQRKKVCERGRSWLVRMHEKQKKTV